MNLVRQFQERVFPLGFSKSLGFCWDGIGVPEIGGAATNFHHLVHHTWRCVGHFCMWIAAKECSWLLECCTKFKMLEIDNRLVLCKMASEIASWPFIVGTRVQHYFGEIL